MKELTFENILILLSPIFIMMLVWFIAWIDYKIDPDGTPKCASHRGWFSSR